jgi:predicted RNA-binding Zn ribbon-like protein
MQPAENDFDTWAPPAATVVRDFVNSYEPQEDAEFLDSATALRDWFAARGLAPAGARLTADDVRAARRVREGLRAVLLAHAGHDADPVASQELDAELARIPLRAAFDADGGIRLEGSGTAFERGMAGVLDAVRRCEAAGDWERLKVCARDTCRWAFYDASRNHARRWCSMSGCGNYVKMRRRAATRTP